ncbi:hypothetical protein HDU93_008762, partial [Gonapodya sp. JEL0774]
RHSVIAVLAPLCVFLLAFIFPTVHAKSNEYIYLVNCGKSGAYYSQVLWINNGPASIRTASQPLGWEAAATSFDAGFFNGGTNKWHKWEGYSFQATFADGNYFRGSIYPNANTFGFGTVAGSGANKYHGFNCYSGLNSDKGLIKASTTCNVVYYCRTAA